MAIAVQDVIGTKRNDVARRENMMRTTLHHASDVKIVSVEKGSDRDAKELLAADLLLQGLLKKLRFGGF